jgi:prepilin-type N-terminal cleavage/methylation domain-containing protein
MRHAFTLFELVITLVIVGIVAAIAAPRITSANEGTRIEAAESRIASEMLAASESARANGSSRSVLLDADKDQFIVYEGANGPSGSTILTINLGASPYRIDVTSTSIPSTPGYLVVDGYGIFDRNLKFIAAADSISKTITIHVPSEVVEGASGLGSGGGGGR